TIKRIAKDGAFVVPQTWGISPELFNNPLVPKSKHGAIKKHHEKAKDFAPLLKKHKVKVGFATDAVGDLDDSWKARRYELYWHAKMFGSNFECLKHATSVAGELLALSGPRNPYPGKLGVIEESALADILIVDGNPLEDLSVLGANSEWFEAPRPKHLAKKKLQKSYWRFRNGGMQWAKGTGRLIRSFRSAERISPATDIINPQVSH
ncbi:MAG: hypothetical protein JRF64_02780, partial [Deltaproteobacteria bacterium]|nr:hypothetical protein [Deltaproteobacteria bacterium]